MTIFYVILQAAECSSKNVKVSFNEGSFLAAVIFVNKQNEEMIPYEWELKLKFIFKKVNINALLNNYETFYRRKLFHYQ